MISCSTRRKLCLAVCLLLGGTVAANVAAAPDTVVAKVAVDKSTNKTVLANQVLDRWQPVAESLGANGTTWREIFLTQFNNMDVTVLARLGAIQSGGDAKAAYAKFSDAIRSAIMQTYVAKSSDKGVAKLASTTNDQVFIPIVPCRIVDTRNALGPISAGTTRNYYFFNVDTGWSWSTGEGGFNPQGGAPGLAPTSCPGTTYTSAGGTLGAAAPAAAVMTVTVVSPTAAGNWILWGGADPIPTVSVLNWNNPGDIAANTTVVPYGGRTGSGSGGSIKDFAVRYNGPSGDAQFIADVVGYFVENHATALDCVYLSNSGTGTVANGTATAVGLPACTAGYTRTGSGCSYNSVFPGKLYETSPHSFSDCIWFNDTGASVAGTNYNAEAVCCRVPGQ